MDSVLLGLNFKELLLSHKWLKLAQIKWLKLLLPKLSKSEIQFKVLLGQYAGELVQLR